MDSLDTLILRQYVNRITAVELWKPIIARIDEELVSPFEQWDDCWL